MFCAFPLKHTVTFAIPFSLSLPLSVYMYPYSHISFFVPIHLRLSAQGYLVASNYINTYFLKTRTTLFYSRITPLQSGIWHRYLKYHHIYAATDPIHRPPFSQSWSLWLQEPVQGHLFYLVVVSFWSSSTCNGSWFLRLPCLSRPRLFWRTGQLLGRLLHNWALSDVSSSIGSGCAFLAGMSQRSCCVLPSA